MTFTINAGKYGGFYIYSDKYSCRLCLGWIAFTIMRYDLDLVLAHLFDMADDVIQTGNAFLSNLYDSGAHQNEETGEEYQDIKDFAGALTRLEGGLDVK